MIRVFILFLVLALIFFLKLNNAKQDANKLATQKSTVEHTHSFADRQP